MPRSEKPLDPAGGEQARFAASLRALRRAAGRPTYREMARTAHYSAPALSKAAAGRTVPTWPCVQAYLRACHVTDDEMAQTWRRRWEAVRQPAPPEADSPGPVVAVPPAALAPGDQPPAALPPDEARPHAITGHQHSDVRKATTTPPATLGHQAAPAPAPVAPAARMPIRIMLVAPEKLTRHGLEAVLTSADGLKVVAEAASLKEALPRAQATRPSVIVIELLAQDDLRTLSSLQEALPGCALLTIIAADASPQAHANLLAGGVTASLSKDIDPGRLCDAVRQLANGDPVVDPALATSLHRLAGRRSMLTPRQRQILSLAAEGRSNLAIAEELVLSVRTVERHMSSILNRLAAGNRMQAVVRAKQARWI
ncbi:LuxR C-terminal-related transcriptional regulator [Streptomyces chartreusis]